MRSGGARVRARVGTAVAGLLAVSVAAGCDASGSRADDPPSGPVSSSPATASGSPSGTPSPSPSSGPTLDPAHAVDAPGRRTGQIAPSDIIVTGSKTLDDGVVTAIRRLPGVTDVEQISLGQAVIENRALTIAAVDPATYRNYTPTGSAQTDEIWGRVAAGELALARSTAKKLPVGADGFLALGSAEDATAVHIGAYAPQALEVDAVVNATWIKDLDLTPGNALLIRSGGTAPITLRTPITQLLRGTGSSVQMTDSIARYGLDPDVVQTAVVVGSAADAVGTYRYTVLGGGRIAPDPAWAAAHIATATVPILGSITCNKAIFPQLIAALKDVQAQGLADKIHPGEYAGCYYPRFIAGSTSLSNHAFGLALDLNVPGNQRGTVGQMDRGVVAIFKRWGFAWGGDWHYTDPMHFEMNRLIAPR
ncbi:M15 family metallopeptidase [Nocardioides sp. URHA0020]|uniref:M15 family metallopeptidase n=1 Tax=Nocardioides sp. URHA0020 TaxID=1380392 RepID=UPI0009E052F6|nr:M15 family metallopeptidase [Nocardioides sp. URHA0020]